jgi:hypothetical protein
LCVESLGMQQMVSLYNNIIIPAFTIKTKWLFIMHIYYALQVLNHSITPLMKVMILILW